MIPLEVVVRGVAAGSLVRRRPGIQRGALLVPRLIEFYMRGKLHLEDWISAKLKLSEINEGFAAMKAGKTVRSVIMFDA